MARYSISQVLKMVLNPATGKPLAKSTLLRWERDNKIGPASFRDYRNARVYEDSDVELIKKYVGKVTSAAAAPRKKGKGIR